MEFAFLQKENRPKLMTPVSAEVRGRSFIMLNYFWVSLGGAIGTARAFGYRESSRNVTDKHFPTVHSPLMLAARLSSVCLPR